MKIREQKIHRDFGFSNYGNVISDHWTENRFIAYANLL